MGINFTTARLFDRYGFEVKENSDMNRVLDHVRRSFKPEKGELKIKSLSNPTYGITGVTEVFVLRQTELAEAQSRNTTLKHILVIDAPESPAHMLIVDAHRDSILASSKLLVTNNHLNYIANDYRLHSKTRCFVVDDFNRANKFGYVVTRHYSVVQTKTQQADGLSVKLKPLYIEGCVPFGDSCFGYASYDDAVIAARNVFITGEVQSHKFDPQSFDSENGQIFVVKSEKAGNVYALVSGGIDKNFGRFISMTGIMDNYDRIEFAYSKQHAVELDHLKFCADFTLEAIVDNRSAFMVTDPSQLVELFPEERLIKVRNVIADAIVDAYEAKRAEKKAKKKKSGEENGTTTEHLANETDLENA